MIAFVRGVIAFSTSFGSIHQVSSHTSTITGVAFTSKIVAAVACQVKPGRITSSPIPMPQASNAICKVTVPFAAEMAYFTPVYSASFYLTLFPSVRYTTKRRCLIPRARLFLPFHPKPAILARDLFLCFGLGPHLKLLICSLNYSFKSLLLSFYQVDRFIFNYRISPEANA